MKNVFWIVTIVTMISVVGFGCSGTAPVLPDGEKIAIFIISDRGIKENMKGDERNDRNEVGEWMEENLIEIFNDAGYKAILIQNRNEYTAGPGKYLLTVSIKDLRLVGSASRFWLGSMTGPTMVENHYDFFGDGEKPLLSYDDGEGTIRDWTKSPEELNERVLEKVEEKLSEVYGKK
jgi:hypothetical protein